MHKLPPVIGAQKHERLSTDNLDVLTVPREGHLRVVSDHTDLTEDVDS
jgi:hypothetical protein